MDYPGKALYFLSNLEHLQEMYKNSRMPKCKVGQRMLIDMLSIQHRTGYKLEDHKFETRYGEWSLSVYASGLLALWFAQLLTEMSTGGRYRNNVSGK
jgi:hypothetical protein